MDAEAEWLALAEQVIAILLVDLRATVPGPHTLTIESDPGFGRQFAWNGQLLNGSGMSSPDPGASLAEVAGNLQDAVCDDERVWPVCPEHDRGLHARGWNGGVWWCTIGHEVSPIGDLANPRPLMAKVDLARWAVAQAEPDFRHLLRPPVVVDHLEQYGVRIEVAGGYGTVPSMDSTDPTEAVAEVADYLQDALAPDTGAWPLCQVHDRGLHAVVVDGVAVWQCQAGPHVVARIGHLHD